MKLTAVLTILRSAVPDGHFPWTGCRASLWRLGNDLLFSGGTGSGLDRH